MRYDIENEDEEKGFYDELLSDKRKDNQAEDDKDPQEKKSGVAEEEYNSLKLELERQTRELNELKKTGTKLERLKSALSDEEPDPLELERERLTAEYDRDPGAAVLKLKQELKEELSAQREQEKKALEFRLIRREISQDYDVNFDDPKVAQALHDELMTMDKSFKSKDMKGALLKAMKITGNDKPRPKAPHFADVGSMAEYQQKILKNEGSRITDGMRRARETSGTGKVFKHIFG